MHGSKNIKYCKTFWYYSASRSVVSELDSICTERGSSLSVASQAGAGTVLALPVTVVLPPYNVEIYSRVLPTASFVINCPYISTTTTIFFVDIFNLESKDAVTHGITFLAADTTFRLFSRNCIASCTMGTGSFPGVKWPGRDADPSPPSSAEV